MTVTSIIALCFSLVFFSCVFSASEAKNLGSKSDADVSDGCKVGNKFYRVGEKWSATDACVEYTCRKAGTFTGLTCPVFQLLPGSKCYMTEMDLKEKYPKCCPQVVCPEEWWHM